MQYNGIIITLRDFFLKKGFIEVHNQHRLSILAACEDPLTVAIFDYQGLSWPLPQTGQMWLEHELLNNPSVDGFFCVTTSYRQEKNPIPGRHDLIFPMFEFEFPGAFNDLLSLESELTETLGFGNGVQVMYRDAMTKYDVDEIGPEQELNLWKDYGDAVFLTDFPIHTSPFWNMKMEGQIAKKIDAIIRGVEVCGSAERSTNSDEMLEMFETISDGMYAKTLKEKFGADRVNKELSDFLNNDFFPRVGGGIGLTRLERAYKDT